MKDKVKKIIQKEINSLFEVEVRDKRGSLLKRSSKYGVGKQMGSDIYIHRMYDGVLPQEILNNAKDKLKDNIGEIKETLGEDWDYHIIKLDHKTNKVTFIKSSDFDNIEEPTVEDYVIVYPDGKVIPRKTKGNQIYHHKWLFVADDYPNFDVEQEKERSNLWLTRPDIDSSKIGWLDNWKNIESDLRE